MKVNAVNPLLPDWLMRCAGNAPGHMAVQCGPVRWSFAELDELVSHLARQLASAGVGKHSRVALLAANGLPYVACLHALTRLGAVLIPLNTRLTPEELRWQLRDALAMLLLSDESFGDLADELTQGISELRHVTLLIQTSKAIATVATPDTSAHTQQPLPELPIELQTMIDLEATQIIMYTSGTTGHPKGVIITYGMQWWNAIGSALNMGHDTDDCWLACMPFFHIGGLAILMRSVIYGISVNIQEKFEPNAVNRAICTEGVTIISVVAVMLQRMLAALDASQQRYPASLRCVLLGGGPASQALLEDCARRSVPVLQTYGLTESCSQAVTLSPADALRKLGSAGRPLAPVQLRIMLDDQLDTFTQEAAAREPGVIFLKGPSITPGYADRSEETGRVLRDGWLSTGDIGYLDEDGYLYVLDRRADLIISGGENIYPAEIESVLASHPAIEEVGVCGLPDSQWGQIPVAFIHLRPGSPSNTDELLAYASQRLARYKIPRAIHFVGQLPRNASGKLLRRSLPQLL